MTITTCKRVYVPDYCDPSLRRARITVEKHMDVMERRQAEQAQELTKDPLYNKVSDQPDNS